MSIGIENLVADFQITMRLEVHDKSIDFNYVLRAYNSNSKNSKIIVPRNTQEQIRFLLEGNFNVIQLHEADRYGHLFEWPSATIFKDAEIAKGKKVIYGKLSLYGQDEVHEAFCDDNADILNLIKNTGIYIQLARGLDLMEKVRKGKLTLRLPQTL